MLLALIAAGVTFSATVVSWYNEQQTASVQAEIEELEATRANLYRLDKRARARMLPAYLQQLIRLLDDELKMRRDVEAELTASVQKSRSIQRERFGPREGNTLLRLGLKLELALGQASAELAHLQAVRQVVQELSDSAAQAGEGFELPSALPSAASLQLPDDFPQPGKFLQFSGSAPTELHGYRLINSDRSAPDRWAVIDQVDHQRKTASFSTARYPLVEAGLSDGNTSLKARVLHRDSDGVHFESHGVHLLLPSNSHGSKVDAVPDQVVEVYPEAWNLKELLVESDKPLHVRLNPPVDGNRTRWNEVRLAVPQEQVEAFSQAVASVDAMPESDPPWRVHERPNGFVAFTMGRVTLETEPSRDLMAFVLKGVSHDVRPPSLSTRMHVGFSVFIPGCDDDSTVSREQFVPLLCALQEELANNQSLRQQRQSALRLRKLSLIYQDQEEHLRAIGSVGIVVTGHESGGRILSALLVGTSQPPWVAGAIQSSGTQRLRACQRAAAFDVKAASWIDQRLGMVRLELSTPRGASTRDISPQEIHRLELVSEGMQQQTLTKALERTISGRFASAGVRSTLLNLSGEQVAHSNLGSEAVERLLETDTDVIAIWGPPGTGKTTTLIKWLLSVFPQEDEAAWPTILMSAPTHVAVTKLLVDLFKKAPWLESSAVRYANLQRIENSGLEAVWHQQLLEDLKPEMRDLPANSEPVKRWEAVLATREGREAAARWLLGPKHVHAATCVGMARRDHNLWEREFDIAIIDEAGKAFGAELMIPCSVAKRVVMVGDHNQLPPTVTSDSLDPEIGYRLPFDEVRSLLERNTFQDIFEQLPAHKKGMLTLQHRMHADIGDLVSSLFYEGELTSARHGGTWNLTRRRVMFLDFSEIRSYRHNKATDSSSLENPVERAALTTLLRRMSHQNRGAVHKVLVVCPYEAQRMKAEREIREMSLTFDVESTTVDAVQGGEADMVILLMTRSGGPVQFLLDRHRLNVALSRARESVIIVGHLRCLTRDAGGAMERLISLGRQRGSVEHVQVVPGDPEWRKLAEWVIPSDERAQNAHRREALAKPRRDPPLNTRSRHPRAN